MIQKVRSPHAVGYYSLLGFEREPFSTSPDPEFFYHTHEHDAALTNLLIELRLRRGLSVIFGDVGTGKTTLCRKLLHELNKRGDMIFHMILDPSFNDEAQFLAALVRNFNIQIPDRGDLKGADILELRDSIEKFLIERTLEDNRTIVLVIDEAQKLDLATLEMLRILLNFETNDHKLIQLVLLGQLELYAKVVGMANFMDRISFKFTLNPLDVRETAELINFRMLKAGYKGRHQIFSADAISEIFAHTKGYPRRINMCCHKILKQMIMDNVEKIDGEYVKSFVGNENACFSVESLASESNQSLGVK